MTRHIRKRPPLLGVNIDHVATLRQARRGYHPDPALAALEAVKGGAGQITVHLREDRRHIQDRDLPELKKLLKVPMNLELALHSGIIEIALRTCPGKACIVPEKRQELTTEGGLDVARGFKKLSLVIPRLQAKGIKVSLFIDPIEDPIRRAASLGADAVEIHTGRYAATQGNARKKEIMRISKAAKLAAKLGLHVHAGHGLDYANVAAVCQIEEIEELNIGYSIVCRSLFTGMRQAVSEMKKAISASLK